MTTTLTRFSRALTATGLATRYAGSATAAPENTHSYPLSPPSPGGTILAPWALLLACGDPSSVTESRSAGAWHRDLGDAPGASAAAARDDIAHL